MKSKMEKCFSAFVFLIMLMMAVPQTASAAPVSELAATDEAMLWRTSAIDFVGDVGDYVSLELDSNDNAHISYYDATNANLKYATNAGGLWTTCTIDRGKGVGLYSSLALDSNDKVHISYYDEEKRDLEYATNAGGSWVTLTIDSKGDVGWSTSIAIDSSNKVHISYYESAMGYVKYATNCGGSWMTYKVGPAFPYGGGTSIAIDSGDRVHISYEDLTIGPELKYATNADGSWMILTIDSGTSFGAGGWSSIALDSNDRVHISYYEYAMGYVKYATNCGGSWTTSKVDICSWSPWTSIAIDSVDKVHISYTNNWMITYRYLMYATNSGGSWTISTVDSVGVDCASLAIDSFDRVHIAYDDRSRHDLKYATNAGPPPTVPLILYNGTVITMEDDMPLAQAIAVKDDRILAVGTNEEILALVETGTRVIDLRGRTVLPGFIDSHCHVLNPCGGTKSLYPNIGPPYDIGKRWVPSVIEGSHEGQMHDDSSSKDATVKDAVRMVLKGGWTSISEMMTNEYVLNHLRTLDGLGELKVRVNAYLSLNNQFERYGDWYKAYSPAQEFSSKLRIGGLKIFTDDSFTYGLTTVYFSQQELTELVSKVHKEGYQVAIHALGPDGMDLTLNALEYALQGEPNAIYRHRVEHITLLRDDQLDRMSQLGIVASPQLNWFTSNPWWIWDARQIIGLDRVDLIARWDDILAAGIPTIGGTDGAAYSACDYSGMNTVYMAVTRIGEPGLPVPSWELDQRITVRQALRLLTIDAAYGTFQEDVKGSIAVGKYADLVVLSENPLSIPVEQLKDVSVMMTMVGGYVEYCAPGHEYLYGTVVEAPIAFNCLTSSNTPMQTSTEEWLTTSEAVTSSKKSI